MPNLPGSLIPPANLPYIGKEEKKVRECLAKEYGQRGFYSTLYGDEPTPSVPNESAVCRLSGAARVVDAFRPPVDPSDLPLRADNLAALTDWELRRYLEATTGDAALWNEIIELERRIGERFQFMNGALDSMAGKIQRIKTAPSARWPMHWTGFALKNPQCLADLPEAQEEALKKIREEFEPFAFYDEYQIVAFGVSLLGREVVPAGIAYCEKGSEQSACFTPRPRDWAAPGCWTRETPQAFSRLECADDGGGVVTKLSRTGAGSGCSSDIQGVLPPFFSERKRTAERRRASGSFKVDLDKFVATIEVVKLAVSRSAPEFTQARRTAVAAIAPQYQRLSDHFSVETARLLEENRSIAAEHEALAALAVTIANRQRSILELRAAIEEMTEKSGATENSLALSRSIRRDAEAKLSSTRSDLDSAQAKRNQVKLECGGAPYAECQNESAKLRYDEALYTALEALDASMTLWSEAMDFLISAMDRELDNEQLLATIKGGLADRLSVEAEQRVVLISEQEEHNHRTTVLFAREQNYVELKGGHDRDRERLAVFVDELGR